MSRSNLFFKVEIEHESGEPPQKIADIIQRQLRKIYGVREVELSNYTTVDES
jgi:hypothetical protein